MNATRSEFSRAPFLMEEHDVRALADLAAKIGTPEYSIACSDGLDRHFASVDDLTGFDNSPSRSIRRFTVSARSRDPSSSFRLSLGNEPDSNLQIQLDGPMPLIGDLNRELESRLAAMRPWYAVLTRGDIFMLGGGFLLASAFLMLALVALGRLGGTTPPPAPNPRRDAAYSLLAYSIFGAGLILVWVFKRVRDRLFPIGAFALGAGRSRHAVLEKIRWTVVVGFLISVVSSLVVAWLLST